MVRLAQFQSHDIVALSEYSQVNTEVEEKGRERGASGESKLTDDVADEDDDDGMGERQKDFQLGPQTTDGE